MTRRITLAADKGYDSRDFVGALRLLQVTPHVAQNTSNRSSAIDRRTTRHAGYEVSQQKRKRIEEILSRVARVTWYRLYAAGASPAISKVLWWTHRGDDRWPLADVLVSRTDPRESTDDGKNVLDPAHSAGRISGECSAVYPPQSTADPPPVLTIFPSAYSPRA